MANRVLLIGLGTTGWNLCEDVVQRIELEYGSIEKVPWLKVLAFETEDVEQKKLHKMGLGHRITLTAEELDALQTRPEVYDRDIKLRDWYERKVVNEMRPQEPGAKRIRMAGRIILLAGQTFYNVWQQTKSALESLDGLTEQVARQALGVWPDGSPANVTFDSIDGKRSPTMVFIAGSAAGGTASGTITDVAYMVRRLGGPDSLNMLLDVIGLIHLPTPLEGERESANAYALMRELNHMQSPNFSWSGGFRIPGEERIRFNAGKPPFDQCFLGVPFTGDQAEGDSRKRLLDSYAHFVYLSAMTSLGLNRDLINTAGSRVTSQKFRGAPEGFFSLGVGVVEFPAPTVFRGVASRIVYEACERILANACDSNRAVDEIRDKFGLNLTNLRSKVFGAATTTLAIPVAPASDLDRKFREASRANRPSVFIDDVIADMERKARSGSTQVSVETAVEQYVLHARDVWESTVRDATRDLSRGPVWLASIVDFMPQALDQLETEIEEAVTKSKRVKSEIEMCIDRIRQSESDPLLRFLMARGPAVSFWVSKVSELTSGLDHLYDDQLKVAVTALRKLFLEVKLGSRGTILDQYKHRVSNPDGVKAWVQELSRHAREVYSECSEALLEVNGKVMYTPGQTVDHYYDLCIQSNCRTFAANYSHRFPVPTDMACAAVAGLLGEIVYSDIMSNSSRFEPSAATFAAAGSRVSVKSDLNVLREQLRPLFIDVFQTNVAELINREGTFNEDAILRDLCEKWSRPFALPDHYKLSTGKPGKGTSSHPVVICIPKGTPVGIETNVRAALGKDAQRIGLVVCEPWRMSQVQVFADLSIHSILTSERYKLAFESLHDTEDRVPGLHIRDQFPYRAIEGVTAEEDARRQSYAARWLIAMGLGMITRSLPFRYTLSRRTQYNLNSRPDLPLEAEFPTLDVSDAVDQILSKDWLSSDLKKCLEDRIKVKATKDSFGVALAQFTQVISNIRDPQATGDRNGLVWQDKLLDPFTFFTLVESEVKRLGFLPEYVYHLQISGLFHPVLKIDNNADLTKIPNSDTRYLGSGFYCSECGEYLGSLDQEATIPDKCPAIQCDTRFFIGNA